MIRHSKYINRQNKKAMRLTNPERFIKILWPLDKIELNIVA